MGNSINNNEFTIDELDKLSPQNICDDSKQYLLSKIRNYERDIGELKDQILMSSVKDLAEFPGKIINIYDHIHNPFDKKEILKDNAESYLWTMENSALIKLRDLILKLKAFIQQPNKGTQSTDLVVEVHEREFMTFVSAMKDSPFDHHTYSVNINRFPHTKEVFCHHFETDTFEIAADFINSFKGFDSGKVLESHRLENPENGQFKYLHKNYVENMTAFQLMQSILYMGWNYLSPINLVSKKVIFGEYTTPGWEELEQRISGVKVNAKGKNLLLTTTSAPSDNNEKNAPVKSANKKLKSEDVSNSENNSKRRRKSFGRFKIIYFQKVFPFEDLGWLMIKCKISKSHKGIFQYKDI